MRPGTDVYLRDLATIEDSTDIPTGYALVNGSRAVYILVTKRADASTLAVVNAVKANLPKMQAAIPEDIHVSFEFDQSPYVTRAIWGVGAEGLLGAVLTGLMVLLFLRDWRSVIVVVLNIPFALLGSVVGAVADRTDDQPDDAGRPGAGRRHSGRRSHRRGRKHPHAIRAHAEHRPRRSPRQSRDGRAAPAGHALHPGRVHSVVLHGRRGTGPVRSAVAGRRFRDGGELSSVEHVRAGPVGLAAAARTTSRTRSRSGPVLRSCGLRDGYAQHAAASDAAALDRACRPIWRVAGLVLWLVGGAGRSRDFSRRSTRGSSSSGCERRPARGSKSPNSSPIEALNVIKKKVGPENVAISLGYVGLIPSSYPINTIYLWTSGPEEAVLRVALKPGSGVRVEPTEGATARRAASRPREAGSAKAARLKRSPPRWSTREARHQALVRAGRHRQRSDELRLADARSKSRSAGRSWPRTAPTPKRSGRSWKRSPRSATCSSCSPSTIRPSKSKSTASWPAPAASRPQAVANSLVAATSSSRFVVPELLARSEHGHRLPGASRNPDRPHGLGQESRPGADQAAHDPRTGSCSCRTSPGFTRESSPENTIATT